MPFAEDVRAELASVTPTRACDRLAELSALFHGAGNLHLRGRGAVSVHLDVSSPAIARRAFSLLRGFDVQTEIRTYRQRAFGRGTRYQLHVEGQGTALQVLHDAGVLGAGLAPLEAPPRRLVARRCCRLAYLRGAVLAGGTISGPRAPQVEIRTAALPAAAFVARVAGQEGVALAVRERGRYAAAHAKGLAATAGVLAAAGAGDAVLALEEHAVMGETRSRANRLANADHANLSRSSRAASAQVRALRRLADAGRLAELPPHLREVAELRLAHPSLSLRELALKCRPPITKAAAHGRLRRLQHIAKT
jgi:cell division protein WhiA